MASSEFRLYGLSSHLLKVWGTRTLNFTSKPLAEDLRLLKKQWVSNVPEYRAPIPKYLKAHLGCLLAHFIPSLILATFTVGPSIFHMTS